MAKKAKNKSDLNYKEIPEEIVETIDEEKGLIRDYISGDWVNLTPEEVEAVQVFAKRLVEDYGYDKSQIQTHPQFRVRKRPSDESKSYPVDIAVFRGKKHIEDELFMIVECKQQTEEAGLRQLKIYMDMSPAVIGVWFNGKSHAYIRKIQTTSGIIDYKPLPNIPIEGQRIEDIGLFKRSRLNLTRNLKAIFKDIRNHLSQQAVGIARDEVIAQEIMNLLFCKIYDEVNTAPNEIVSFRSGIDEKDKDVAARIKKIFEKVKTDYADIFETSDSIGLDDRSINYVVGELQNYCIIKAERDVLGDAFEVFIGKALKGEQGQFFTPKNIVKFAVSILNPTEEESIIDPACGSGGFLIVAVENVWNKIKDTAEKRGFKKAWIEDKQKSYANKQVRGIDKDSFLTKITKAYMAIIGDGRGGIFCENSLELYDKWKTKTKGKITFDSFDLLFTNPPFGAKIPVVDEEILKSFNMGYKWSKKQHGKTWEKTSKRNKKQPPQILFIERCLELLKPGGKMAIVLPDGVLGGSKVGYVANFIRKNAKLIALIDLPKETFQPSTSTKTHLVFLQKKTEEEKQDKEYMTFMAVLKNVGHDSKGKPLFKEENGDQIINDDLPMVLSKYEAFQEKKLATKDFTEKGYLVSSHWLENYLVAKRYLPKYINNLNALERLNKEGKVELKTINEIKKSLFTGANVGGEDYVEESEYKYIMTDCVTKYGLNMDSMKYITKKAYEANKTKALKENDIVINRTGNPGISIIVPKDLEGTISCGFVFVLRLKKEYNPYYVAALLDSHFGTKQTERCSFGSVLEHITKDDLEDVIIPFPTDKKIINDIINKYKDVEKEQIKAREGLTNIYNSFNFSKT